MYKKLLNEKIFILLGIVMFSLASWKIVKCDKIAENLKDNKIRDISGSIFGAVERQDDWIYYTNFANKEKLYKIKIDGSDKTKLNNQKSKIIGIISDWIYYTDWSGKGEIYKVKTDGTNRTKIVGSHDDYKEGVIGIAVDKDRIYYENWYEHKIYMVTTKGLKNKKISDYETFGVSQPFNDWFYFISNFGGEDIWDGRYLFKVNIKDNEIIKICNDKIRTFSIIDEWIYYINMSDGGTLYKLKNDGANRTKVTKKAFKKFDISGEWIYFIWDNGDLYKIKTNGSEETKLFNIGGVGEFKLSENWIYYTDINEHKDEIYRIRTDGSSKEPFVINK